MCTRTDPNGTVQSGSVCVSGGGSGSGSTAAGAQCAGVTQ